jgi:hypothetical protein
VKAKRTETDVQRFTEATTSIIQHTTSIVKRIEVSYVAPLNRRYSRRESDSKSKEESGEELHGRREEAGRILGAVRLAIRLIL